MIETWSQGPADAGMPEALLVGLMETVHRHPWWRARASLAATLLAKRGILPPARVADVGCGWGTNLDLLEHRGYRVTGFDISRRALELIDNPSRNLVEADLNQEFPSHGRASYDACLVLDVIEHLNDDRGALARVAELLVPGGICIVSVPALPDLFSDYDQLQGHRRRYVPKTLREAFRDTGLQVESIFWWGFWMLPVLRSMRAKLGSRAGSELQTYADYLRLPPWPGPQLMTLAYAIEKPLAPRGWLPKGTSLFAVARR